LADQKNYFFRAPTMVIDGCGLGLAGFLVVLAMPDDCPKPAKGEIKFQTDTLPFGGNGLSASIFKATRPPGAGCPRRTASASLSKYFLHSWVWLVTCCIT
jgi:hypothetical protein